MSEVGARLGWAYGSRLDRSRVVAFRFEGRGYSGYAGDTIASALAANGRYVLSRSFKYHRPRGVLTMAGQDANSLVQVGPEPNVFADSRRIEAGMEVWGQNYAGSLDRDRNAILDRLSAFLPVGFYYRAFWGPTKGAFLKLWEPAIRKRAGLGRITLDAPAPDYDKAYRFCDVAVIGGGPAGLSAALAAAQAGAEVMLVEQEPELGGSLSYRRGERLQERRRALLEAVAAQPGITVLTEATCAGCYADGWLAIEQRTRLHKLRAKALVVAAGGFEQPVVFRNNDLPGIMLGSAAVVLTCNAEGYEVAADLAEAGVEVAAIVDPRPEPAESAAARVLSGSSLREAEGRDERGGRGLWHLRRVLTEPLGQGAPEAAWIDCDLLCVSGGTMPAYQLPAQAGARLTFEERGQRFAIERVPERMWLAGATAGASTLDEALDSGARAGAAAADSLGFGGRGQAARARTEASRSDSFDWPLTAHPRGKDFVDFDEDLQVKDIENAVAEGYAELELVKRFSTVGMGPSQGRQAALATAKIVAAATGRSVAEVGVTTARPPFAAMKLGVLAGDPLTQHRHTPMHHRHLEAGASMQPVGAWWRPSYYGPAARRDEAIAAEVAAVRNGVAMLDVSTLGSLEVRGPDAAELLNRLYTLRYDSLPVGRTRYLLLVNEMGSIIDDGMAYRIAEDHFYVTATTGAVGAVYQLMLFMNAEWRLQVDVLNATAAFAAVNVTGPEARALLAALSDDIDFSAEALPYLHGRQGRVAGQPARVLRIGFTGEASYELHVPASRGEALWDRLMAAGAPLGLRPYGLEASRILRLEKGHIIIGQDTDAMSTPDQVGMAWAVSKKKPYFLGKRSLEQRRRVGLGRRLVGFETAERAPEIAESCLVMEGERPVGFVTSTCWSPTLNKRIGLAYAAPEAAPGQSITIRDRAGAARVVPVVAPHFYDPLNARQSL